jgi:DNA-binding transcriptional regulator YhcF (GntR family)
MTTIETYLANAAAQRAAAEKTNLPNRREMHERSAVTWETMARAVEDTQGRAEVNRAAKAGAASGV